MKSHDLLVVHPPGRATRYYVDGKRVPLAIYERLWDRAWFAGTLDASTTSIRKDVIRNRVCARVAA